MDIKETGWDSVDWMHVTEQWEMAERCEHADDPGNFSTSCGTIIFSSSTLLQQVRQLVNTKVVF
jgi:hypothetical protein